MHIPLISRWSVPAQWVALLALSSLVGGLLDVLGLPAALLLGPMLAGILFGIQGATARVPPLPFLGAQSLIGMLIANAVTAEILVTLAADWAVFLGIILSTIAASTLLGWLMSRWRLLPGTTAIWGSSPGAANAMTLMAGAFGADIRLVAFMQYLRVVFVAGFASLVAQFWGAGAGERPPHDWFPALPLLPFAATLAVAFGGAALGRALRWPAASLLTPMLLGAVLHATGLLTIVLPEWLLAICYALVGWRIGLGFTRPIIRAAARAFSRVVLSILVLLGFCGGLAALLVVWLGIDPLTAYLATSPGGIDTIAIIAAGTPVDLSFIMGLQVARLILVILLAPPIARFMARRVPPDPAA
ncbi:AbrB family transcriptional regulator [Pseudoroseomonas cervicalis]|uniref:AbrB family transcriptional regulator n=1 Tax=Teichococcus cervicalis TaxID=204525 RepID=UPI0022F17DEB|nr:AbrB family transcriptional regulator [Pseudoroseomonas cervicalis]WBV42996.1 AbrB family transcriptional regulator [Pseudoroseomonas cervicalis]